MTLAGFPHSGIPGSTPTCGSPRLFAACRALLRLSVPRHPPCALVRLTDMLRRLLKRRGHTGPPIPRSTHALVLSRLLKDASNTTPNSHDPCCQTACSRHQEIVAEPDNLHVL